MLAFYKAQSKISIKRDGKSPDLKVIVHGPERVTMALCEGHIIVHWTPLIKNQDVHTRYLESHPPFWKVPRWPP